MLITSFTTYKPSKILVFYQSTLRFLEVGWMLHGTVLFSVFSTVFYIDSAYESFLISGLSIKTLVWSYLSSFFVSVAVIAEIDAYGRYQNYKQIKDLMHHYGFDRRLLEPFMNSRCQRKAILVAANDLKLRAEVKNHIIISGYKWYHILPDAFIKNPMVILTKIFWKSILFTKYYRFKSFYW